MIFVGTSLIDMHEKCRSIDIVFSLFYKILERGVVSWNSMITRYMVNENENEAFMLLT